MGRRGLSFRLLCRVIFVCLCVTVASFYSGDISRKNREEEKSKEPRNIKGYEQFFRQQQGISPVTENVEQVDAVERQIKSDLISKIARKGHVRKYENLSNFEKENINNSTLQKVTTTPRSDATRNSSKLQSTTRRVPHQPLLLPSPEVKITRKGLNTQSIISHSCKINRSSDDTKIISNTTFKHGVVNSKDFKGVVKGENFESFKIQHVRKRREFDTTSESVTDQIDGTYTFKIKYGDEYRVWNNFSMMYRDRMYYYDEYRVTDDGLELCNSSNFLIQKRWRNFVALEKRMMAFKNCNVSVDISNWSDYILFKDFTAFFILSEQNFTRQEYGVIFGYFMICSAKLSLSCNDFLVKVTFDDQYNVWQNFSLSYTNKTYDYREYHVRDNNIEICSSSDRRIQTMWKNRNIMENKLLIVTCNGRDVKQPYVVDKKLNVYWTSRGKYLTRNDYAVSASTLYICANKFVPLSTELTEEDMSMCSDAIINIKHDDEFRVWKNFSLLYKNKMYDYTQYRGLNDGIKICNSTDMYVQNSWKLRNYWVKKRMAYKNCSARTIRIKKLAYHVDKQFTVYLAPTGQYFTRNRYRVFQNRLYICRRKLRPVSSEFTKQDVLMCSDAIVSIQYKENYKVWKNFSILYKDKTYDYTEYRALNDGIKICNSTDIFVKNSWKLRNYWVKDFMAHKNCNTSVALPLRRYYTVAKHFTVYLATTGQHFTKNNYGLWKNNFHICRGKLKSLSSEFTKEDQIVCSDAIINIQKDENYKLWKNFSILYKGNMYDHTDYRILNDGIKICNSTDLYVRNCWKLRNSWIKNIWLNKSCTTGARTVRVSRWTAFHEVKSDYHGMSSSRISRGFVSTTKTKLIIVKNDFGLIDGKFYKCSDKLWLVSNSKHVFMFLGALALSSICLLLLLIVYCMLPELRTLPGMNLMSLSIAFLFTNIALIAFISLNLSENKVSYPCAPLLIAITFCSSSILTNAAVNVYHLKRTFSDTSFVKSTTNSNNLKLFLKYTLFSWGIPALLSIVEIIVVQVGLVSYSPDPYLGLCHKKYMYFAWYIISELIFPGCLILYTIFMFIFTAYRIRQKLKASNNIAHKSNIMKNRRSFVLLLKLSTTAALTWILFLIFMNINFYSKVKMALGFITLLSGVYIAIAFVFTRKNYKLLKKKYFSESYS